LLGVGSSGRPFIRTKNLERLHFSSGFLMSDKFFLNLVSKFYDD
jgi:hypothetical protein